MKAEEWFYEDFLGREHSAVSERSLVKLIRKGIVTRECRAWKKGMDGWSRLDEIEQFAELINIGEKTVHPTSDNKRTPPYQPPSNIAVQRPPARKDFGVSSEGILFIREGRVSLPNYCVICGENAQHLETKQLDCVSWVGWLFFPFLIFVNPVISLFLPRIGVRSVSVQYSLCETHRNRIRSKSRRGYWSLTFGVIVMGLAVASELPGHWAAYLCAGLLIVGSAILRIMKTNILSAKRYYKNRIYLAGAGSNFIKRLSNLEMRSD